MRKLLLTTALAVSVGAACQANPTGTARNVLKGDYVEARTASVFAGPCHYNGQLTTAGREAEMVWRVSDGSWNGVSLKGVTAMAAVGCEENLREASAPRRSVLYVDTQASKEQTEAMVAALKAKYARTFGEVVAVKRVPIAFKREGENYRVEAKGVTRLAIDAMPDHACCKMPSMVCYDPLVALKGRRVGHTSQSGVTEKALGMDWSRQHENSAFYGAFTL